MVARLVPRLCAILYFIFISVTCILLNIDIFEINRVIFSNLSTEGPVIMKMRGSGLRSQPSNPASPPLGLSFQRLVFFNVVACYLDTVKLHMFLASCFGQRIK